MMVVTTTAIFPLTTHTSSQAISALQTGYPNLTTTNFSLNHSIYRSTTTNTNHLQVLQLSNDSKHTYLCTSTAAPDVDKVAVVAIPTDSDADFRRLLRDKFGVLWQPMKAGDLRATGSELEIGVFRVVVVDVVRERGVAGANVEHRGTSMSISLLDEEASGEEVTAASTGDRALILDFCAEIGLRQDTGEVWGDCKTAKDEAELWCLALRQNMSSTVTGRPQPAVQ